jgi:hypothetical protein
MTAPIDPRDFDELEVRMFASLLRALELAPAENKLKIFHFMCRTAADEIAIRRQQAIDDLWAIAQDTGLVATFGNAMVQDALSGGFGGDA